MNGKIFADTDCGTSRVKIFNINKIIIFHCTRKYIKIYKNYKLNEFFQAHIIYFHTINNKKLLK